MRLRLAGLWRHADFRRFWAGQTVSLLGSQVTLLALPLVAVFTLKASALQMGLLIAAGEIPALLFGLFAGVWVDRRRRRLILIIADLGRGALLLSIPVAAVLGALDIALLYVVTFLVGSLSLVFDIAAQSYLPTLIDRQQLVEGNSRLELSRSVAEMGGPALAGGLVQLATAPLAIAADACSFFYSALMVVLIRAPEPAPVAPQAERHLWHEIGEGLRLIAAQPLLRSLAGTSGLLTFSNSVLEAVVILYLTRDLGLAPAVLGGIFAVGSIGFLLGALAAQPLTRVRGVGPLLVTALVCVSLSDVVVPLATGAPVVLGMVLAAAQFLFGLGLVVYNVNAVSLRQSVTPDRLQGRMNASMRFLVRGLTPLGALLGGMLGERLGLRTTLFFAAAGELSAALWLLGSPLRTLQSIPAQPVE